MLNKFPKILLVISWTIFIFVILTKEISSDYSVFADIVKTFQLDKLIHFLLFGILAFLLLDCYEKKNHSFNFYAFEVFVLGAFYALFCEWVQKFIYTRTSDIFDLLAGILGIALFIYFGYRRIQKQKPKLLLHICCVGCGVYISQILKNDFRVSLYFYNPNIFPKEEYDRRLIEAEKIAKKFKLKLIVEKYDHDFWLEKVRGREADRERGERCLICYEERLRRTAQKAKELNFDFFSTTLTMSPHKDAKAISDLGRVMEKKFGIKFLDRDFKKQDGFKKSSELSRQLGLYRQNYCGCEFSRKA
ncbi:MAG: epoxyqueuosine reductase QueH [Patescibacteria group bacterium]|nr:epoxyqueuosine reductase QueH [Patescibacteria group bacterium]MDD4611316.1 epoxyqueuosine reductase QueH [Patescibacteria group bacterium]